MSFCYTIFLDLPYFRSYDLIAKPNGTYITAVAVAKVNNRIETVKCNIHFNVLIWPLCNGSSMKFHQNITLHSVQIVNKVWFWDNDGMC